MRMMRGNLNVVQRVPFIQMTTLNKKHVVNLDLLVLPENLVKLNCVVIRP